MPSYAIRKKLAEGTIIDLNICLWDIWSTLKAQLQKKRMSKKQIQRCIDVANKCARSCEIRLPGK